MPTALAAVLLLLAQENATVTRTEKAPYVEAITKCREAESLLETDPQTSIDRLTEVIANPRVAAKIERRIRIEERPSEYTPYYNFTPYLYRAQARLALARKLEKTNAVAAQRALAEAEEDLKASVERKVERSAELLETARTEQARLKAAAFKPSGTPAAADPLVKFRESWEPLIFDERFKSAAKLAQEDKTLQPEQRKGFLESGEQKCREVLLRQVSAFRPRFVSGFSQGLDRLTQAEFEVMFSLPAPDEMVVSHPVLDWARAQAATFREAQAGTAQPSALLDAAAAAADLEASVVNPWFRSVEQAAFERLQSAASAEVARSRDAGRTERETARRKVDDILAQYKAFVAKIDPKVRERYRVLVDHATELENLTQGFPADLAELDALDAQIDGVFASASPEAELGRLERTLQDLESRPNVTRESRQRLYTGQAVAAALRGLLAGRAEETVASQLLALKAKLKEVGGPLEVKQYGPRVERVLASLKP
jgi:hypothetical protein